MNRLTTVPPEFGQLKALKVLDLFGRVVRVEFHVESAWPGTKEACETKYDEVLSTFASILRLISTRAARRRKPKA